MSHQTIIVLDFGSQCTSSSHADCVSCRSTRRFVRQPRPSMRFGYKPAASSCRVAPNDVRPGAPVYDPGVFELGVPGAASLLRHAADGASPGRRGVPQRRTSSVMPVVRVSSGPSSVLFAGVPDEIRVWASHGDFVAAPPPSFDIVATSANAGGGDGQPGAAPHCCSTRVVHSESGLGSCQLRLHGLQLHKRLDDEIVHRRVGGANSREGG